MIFSKAVETALIDLASRGLWLVVKPDGKLQPIAVHDGRGGMTDDLRHRLAKQRQELHSVIPRFDDPNLALTGPVVRVIFALLSTGDQQRPDLTLEEFLASYDDLSLATKVSFLWWFMDRPAQKRDQLKEVA